MFSEELEKYSWEETTREIYSKTAADVELALSKSQLAIDDFMALISPAAEKYLEPMAALSQKYTLQRFGKTISMYIPLYITNSCTNFCVYCGFNHNNPLKRVILNEEEILNELHAIKKLGNFENLLIVPLGLDVVISCHWRPVSTIWNAHCSWPILFLLTFLLK